MVLYILNAWLIASLDQMLKSSAIVTVCQAIQALQMIQTFKKLKNSYKIMAIYKNYELSSRVLVNCEVCCHINLYTCEDTCTC